VSTLPLDGRGGRRRRALVRLHERVVSFNHRFRRAVAKIHPVEERLVRRNGKAGRGAPRTLVNLTFDRQQFPDSYRNPPRTLSRTVFGCFRQILDGA